MVVRESRFSRQAAAVCGLAVLRLLIGCGGSDSDSSGIEVRVNPPAVDLAAGTSAGSGGAGGAPANGMAGVAGGVSTGTGTGGTGGMLAGTGGTGGTMSGTGGMMAGTGGMMSGTGGMMSGTGGMMAGTGGMMSGGACGSGTPTDGRPTTGPPACIVEQHNAVRAMVPTSSPLPPLTWSADIAKYAQEWTDMTCASPKHRTSPMVNGKRLGENLYASFGNTPDAMPGKQAVDGWSAEVACYTFGPFFDGDKCDMACTSAMNSDGCGHYTQVVWRASTEIGCGATTCGSGFSMTTVVICNYGPAGNFVGALPY